MTHFRVGLNFVLSGLAMCAVAQGGARTDYVFPTSQRRLDTFLTYQKFWLANSGSRTVGRRANSAFPVARRLFSRSVCAT